MRVRYLPLFALLLLCCGCGSSGPPMAEVAGTIIVDGQPLEQGDIVFLPNDTALAPQAAKVADGAYQLMVPQGRCRVEIRGLRIDENTPRFEGQPLAGNFLPARYNQNSELFVQIEPDNETVDWTLDSR